LKLKIRYDRLSQFILRFLGSDFAPESRVSLRFLRDQFVAKSAAEDEIDKGSVFLCEEPEE